MKTILTLIALAISVAAFSQSRLRAETYSYHYKVDGTWEEWSKNYVSNDIIVFDYSKDKITIDGLYVIDENSFIIFNQEFKQSYNFDYTVSGDKLTLGYCGNQIEIEKQVEN